MIRDIAPPLEEGPHPWSVFEPSWIQRPVLVLEAGIVPAGLGVSNDDELFDGGSSVDF
jgi:hypothetical protein